MSEFEFVFRDSEGNRHVADADETTARELLRTTSRDVDEALRVLRENPNGQMNCEGGYLRHARR